MRDHRYACKGQSLVEFALVVPILLLILLGIIDFGRAWQAKNVLTGAAREGVRIAAVQAPAGSMELARDRAAEVLEASKIPTDNITVTDAPAAFGAVSVSVSYDFPFLFIGFFTSYLPGFNGGTGSLTLTSTTTMRREY